MAALSVKVSRVGKSPLEVNAAAAGYEVMRLGPGADSVRLIKATSDYMHGSALLGWVAEDTVAVLTVRVSGSTPGEIGQRVAALRSAFRAFRYTVTVTYEDRMETWSCMPSTVIEGDGGEWDSETIGAGWSDVLVQVERHPSR